MLELVKKYRKEKKRLGFVLDIAWRKWKFNEIAINSMKRMLEKGQDPIIIPFSGNRNSRTLIRVLYETLERMKSCEREIYIVHVQQQDFILSYNIPSLFDKMKSIFNNDKIHFHIINNQENFYIKLIGQGVPAPNSSFWWCGQEDKIKPMVGFFNKFSKYVIVSSSTGGKRNEVHPINNAKVYKPFNAFNDSEVWELFLTNTLWGDDIGDVYELYETYYKTDSPLNINEEPIEYRDGCGTLEFDSSFSCWFCTHSAKYKTLENFYSKNEWIRPLLTFNKSLKEIMMKSKIDELNMQRGYIKKGDKIVDDRKEFNSAESGTIKYEIRRIMFNKLLETEREINSIRLNQGLSRIQIISNETKEIIEKHISTPLIKVIQTVEDAAGLQLSLF
ncbi:TPA: hypothetical protein ACGX4N_004640 [Bacillus cereus]